MTTFSTLLAQLQKADADQPLVFQTHEGKIGAGYHVTELKHSFTKGIDCGGNIREWTETRLQLLDGKGSTHMNVGKFRTIIEKSIGAMPELADAPLLVEFGHQNDVLMLLSASDPEVQDSAVLVALGDVNAVCKPALGGLAQSVTGIARCGKKSAPQETVCCPTDTPVTVRTPCC